MKKATYSHWISIFGAREHNLKSVDVAIPKDTLTVITGPSGSGKSSLALDILYNEGRRRYVDSLSSYARQFLGTTKKPEVDRIEGLCPAIAIEQKTVGSNPRSTVGTITEIYDYLRVLYARIGHPSCPLCHEKIKAESPETIVSLIMQEFKGVSITITAPLYQERKGEFTTELKRLFTQSYYKFMIDGRLHRFQSETDIYTLKLKKTHRHTISLVVDSCVVSDDTRSRIAEAVETAFGLADQSCVVMTQEKEHVYSSRRICLPCAISFPELEPRLFSFNSPIGACEGCNGLGSVYEWPGDSQQSLYDMRGLEHGYQAVSTCTVCYGARLNKYARSVTIQNQSIVELSRLSIADLHVFFQSLTINPTEVALSQGLITEIVNRLTFLIQVGLPYLSLQRTARTLSGGEGQRIRLATQIGSGLSGVLYILDEPSIGLHQRDNDRLIETLKKLRDQGNTVVVVEHDLDTMKSADYIIDMGPAAGTRGGMVTAYGSPDELKNNPASLSGAYLSKKREIAIPEKYRKPSGFMTLSHANTHNLKDLTVHFPLGVMCGIAGVSGSGKSTLIMHELVPALKRELMAPVRKVLPTRITSDELTGAESIESMVVIDQSPIGRTPRSNPATYLGVFDEIRALFASLPESNAQGYSIGRFSFNVPQGRCFECKGDGVITVSMQFLPDVTLVCKMCKGKRYNHETLKIRYKGKTIADVLEMTAYQALEFFAAHPRITRRLKLMCDVGLDYILLGQPSTTLSGGEAQRIKLVEELAKRGRNTLYILDEPTTGLHSSDIERLLTVLTTLVDKGNSMLIIEHNLDVLKTVDYLIDLGPEGGQEGGTIVAHGTPHQVAACPESFTGKYLKPLLETV